MYTDILSEGYIESWIYLLSVRWKWQSREGTFVLQRHILSMCSSTFSLYCHMTWTCSLFQYSHITAIWGEFLKLFLVVNPKMFASCQVHDMNYSIWVYTKLLVSELSTYHISLMLMFQAFKEPNLICFFPCYTWRIFARRVRVNS
jgi:hypothetical protein